MVEVVARVFFVQQFRSIDGENGLIKLELTNSSHTLSAKLDPALLSGRERLIDGQAYRCQLLREPAKTLHAALTVGRLCPRGSCTRDSSA